ncbi:hypothetical protein B0H63DRAFT_428441 [Podospora didyma]|uniref:AA1-like domain-containing protein n=1 Tax=Podospora didyma TaxID=330526 RepID=A0AAE0NYB9_9PEZI|nr:hypothetical protein B0H63DRAFT_428441 [Podospora didyma]
MALIYVALGAVLVSATAVHAQANANCTTNSFTVPSWYVEEFKKGGPGSDVTFELLNRATNVSVELQCDAQDTWSNCTTVGSSDPFLQASVLVKSATASVQVQQSWSCSDRDATKPLEFTASGSATIPLVAGGAGQKSANPIDLIKASLHAPVSITPAYADGPTGHSNPGCASKTPTWTLGTVIFLNETGDGDKATESQSIQFQVTNVATGQVAGCLMYFAAGAEDPAVHMTCGGEFDLRRRSRYNVVTEAVFYPRSWRFSISQTWFCDDADAARPVSISATGNATLALNCTKDSTTTTACQAASITVAGNVVSEQALPPYSIEDPLPAPDGCTISSIVAPSWTLSNFEVDKNEANTTGGHDHGHTRRDIDNGPSASISFNMKLNTKAVNYDYPVFVNHNDVQLADAEAWYPCSFGPGEVPIAPKSCSFQYKEATSTLTIKVDWVCIDIDEAHPVQFSGTATTTVPKLDCVSQSSGVQICTAGDDYSWEAQVANVTWKAAEPL